MNWLTLLPPTSGLYPFRIVYQEGGGDAYLVLKSGDVGRRTS